MSNKQTPGPWAQVAWTTNPNHAGTDVVAQIREQTVLIAACSGSGQDFDQAVENAAFIVKACNAHASLLEILSALLDLLDHVAKGEPMKSAAALAAIAIREKLKALEAA